MICLKFVFLQLTVLLTAKCKAKFEQDIYVYIFKKMGWFFFHKTTISTKPTRVGKVKRRTIFGSLVCYLCHGSRLVTRSQRTQGQGFNAIRR